MTAPILQYPDYLTAECRKLPRKNRVIKASFGNGYMQVAKDGLNDKIDSWKLIYKPLQDTELQNLRDFIDQVGCDVWFTWTPFGESTSKKWSIVEDSYEETFFKICNNVIIISFTIIQRFDLGT